MIYPCKTIPLSQVADSRIKTMCDLCKSVDCENPIENKWVSVIGIKKKMRVYSTRSTDGIVVQCDGFVS